MQFCVTNCLPGSDQYYCVCRNHFLQNDRVHNEVVRHDYLSEYMWRACRGSTENLYKLSHPLFCSKYSPHVWPEPCGSAWDVPIIIIITIAVKIRYVVYITNFVGGRVKQTTVCVYMCALLCRGIKVIISSPHN